MRIETNEVKTIHIPIEIGYRYNKKQEKGLVNIGRWFVPVRVGTIVNNRKVLEVTEEYVILED